MLRSHITSTTNHIATDRTVAFSDEQFATASPIDDGSCKMLWVVAKRFGLPGRQLLNMTKIVTASDVFVKSSLISSASSAMMEVFW